MHSVCNYGKPLGIIIFLLLARPSGTAAQVATSTAAPHQAGQSGFQDRYPRYQLQAGDSFDLSFEFSPEFNQVVTVQPDGFITLREIGDVYVSGLTFPQVQDLVLDKYSRVLYQPKILLTPKDIQKRYFIAAGEVAKPGKYELRGDTTTVEQAIAMAGGFTQDRAKHSEVVLFRRNGNTLSFGRVVNVKKMLKERDLREDPYLKPGDLIYVPQTTWSKMRQFVPVPGVGVSMMPALP